MVPTRTAPNPLARRASRKAKDAQHERPDDPKPIIAVATSELGTGVGIDLSGPHERAPLSANRGFAPPAIRPVLLWGDHPDAPDSAPRLKAP